MKIRTMFLLLVAMSMLLNSTTVIAQSKRSSTTSIDERLSKYLPVFDDPSCGTYLIEFGSNDKAVKLASKEIGIQFLSKAPIPQVEDGHLLIYADPENIRTESGKVVTNTVLYIFSFTPFGDYFSFSSNFTFKTPKLAKEAYTYLLNIAGGSESESENTYTTILTCDDRKSPYRDKTRMLTLRRDGNSVTFVLIDYDLVEEYLQSVGS